MNIAKNSKNKIKSLLLSYVNGTIDYYRTKLSSGYSVLHIVQEAKEFDDLPLLCRLIEKEFEQLKEQLVHAREAFKC